MKKNTKFYEDEILKSIEIIEFYVNWMTFADFQNNLEKFDACCMRLQHIWECWIKLGELVWDNYKGIPFAKMRWFRNRITHDYAWIDDLIIWRTIKDNLPILKDLLK